MVREIIGSSAQSEGALGPSDITFGHNPFSRQLCLLLETHGFVPANIERFLSFHNRAMMRFAQD